MSTYIYKVNRNIKEYGERNPYTGRIIPLLGQDGKPVIKSDIE